MRCPCMSAATLIKSPIRDEGVLIDCSFSRESENREGESLDIRTVRTIPSRLQSPLTPHRPAPRISSFASFDLDLTVYAFDL